MQTEERKKMEDGGEKKSKTGNGLLRLDRGGGSTDLPTWLKVERESKEKDFLSNSDLVKRVSEMTIEKRRLSHNSRWS